MIVKNEGELGKHYNYPFFSLCNINPFIMKQNQVRNQQLLTEGIAQGASPGAMRHIAVGTRVPASPPAPRQPAEDPHADSSALVGSCHRPSGSSSPHIPTQGTEGTFMLKLGTALKLQAASTFDPWERELSPAAAGRLIYRSEGIWVNKDNQSLSSQRACPHFTHSHLHSPLL